jgi:succinate dehydrogenase/fumarate reductase cytochrome b subunit
LFLIEHFSGNALLLLKDPAPYLWYTEVMGNSFIVRILEVALLGTFAIHISVGLYMRWNYLKLKKRVATIKPPKSMASRFVGATEVIILLFLVVHSGTSSSPTA